MKDPRIAVKISKRGSIGHARAGEKIQNGAPAGKAATSGRGGRLSRLFSPDTLVRHPAGCSEQGAVCFVYRSGTGVAPSISHR